MNFKKKSTEQYYSTSHLAFWYKGRSYAYYIFAYRKDFSRKYEGTEEKNQGKKGGGGGGGVPGGSVG